MEIKNFIHSQGIQLLRKLVHHRNKFYTFSKQINKKFFKNNNIWSDNRDDKKHGGNNIKSQTSYNFFYYFYQRVYNTEKDNSLREMKHDIQETFLLGKLLAKVLDKHFGSTRRSVHSISAGIRKNENDIHKHGGKKHI